jgi:hypothetical protein
MSDHIYRTGVLGRPKPAERCPRTGRIYEDGSGALSKEEQTALFMREAAIAADMPHSGEFCPQTGRQYEIGGGAQTKTQQTERFLDELSPAAKAQRQAAANALFAIEPSGRA